MESFDNTIGFSTFEDGDWINVFLENATEPICILNENGEVTEANTSAGKIFDLPVEQLLEKKLFILFATSYLTFQELKHALSHKRKHFTFQISIKKAAPLISAYSIKASLFHKNGEAFYILFFKNLDQKNELENARQLLHEAEEMAKLGSFEIDLQTKLVRLSPGMHQLFGFSANNKNLMLKDILNRLHPDDREQAKVYFEKEVLVGHKPYDLQQRLVMPDSSEKLIHSRGKVLYDDQGKPLKFWGMSQDITESRKNEVDVLKVIWEEQEKERQRIAMEIHDSFGPLLSGVKMYLEHVKPLVETSPKESDQWSDTLQNLNEIFRGLREISHELLPKVLLDFGLVAALENLCDKIDTNGNLSAKFFHYGEIGRYSRQVELNLYRIAQELTNNVIKHAQASSFVMQLVAHPKSLVLTIEDDGIGFNPEKEKLHDGIGMMNMKSRMKVLNGDFTVDSSPGKGTFISIEIPLHA